MINPRKPIRALFVMRDICLGGVSKVAFQYLLALQQIDDFQLTLVSLYPISSDWARHFLDTHGIEYRDGLISDPGKKEVFFLLKWVRKIRCHLEKLLLPTKLRRMSASCDVVLDFALPACFRYIQHLKTPLFGWVHMSFSVFQRDMVKRVMLPKYRRLICLTDSFKADYGKAYPALSQQVIRLYNPVDADEMRRAAEEPAPQDIEGPYFIAVQRLSKDKDVGAVIRAFKRFLLKRPDFRLCIVGEGSERHKLEAQAKDCPHIIFTGLLYNPYPLLKGAEALILSSTRKHGEGLGYVLLEAQALGVLCISSDVKAGPSEILSEGQAGYLFEPESEDALYEAMCRAAGDEAAHRAMVQRATEQLERFRADRIAEELVQEIRHVLAEDA